MIVSTISTALVLTVAASFFMGDQRFSRLWFAAGWAFSVLGLVGWRWVTVAAYAALRQAVVPARKLLIVGANPVGREIARDLARGSQVVGYVDNGSDLDEDVALVGPIASLERLVQQSTGSTRSWWRSRRTGASSLAGSSRGGSGGRSR